MGQSAMQKDWIASSLSRSQRGLIQTYMTVSTICTKLLVLLQSDFIGWYIIISWYINTSWTVLCIDRIVMIKVQVTVKVQNFIESLSVLYFLYS